MVGSTRVRKSMVVALWAAAAAIACLRSAMQYSLPPSQLTARSRNHMRSESNPRRTSSRTARQAGWFDFEEEKPKIVEPEPRKTGWFGFGAEEPKIVQPAPARSTGWFSFGEEEAPKIVQPAPEESLIDSVVKNGGGGVAGSVAAAIGLGAIAMNPLIGAAGISLAVLGGLATMTSNGDLENLGKSEATLAKEKETKRKELEYLEQQRQRAAARSDIDEGTLAMSGFGYGGMLAAFFVGMMLLGSASPVLSMLFFISMSAFATISYRLQNATPPPRSVISC